MRKKITVEPRLPKLTCVRGVVFRSVDGWFGHITRGLKMDIVYPEANSESVQKRCPCVLWICGGGWLDMDRSAHLPYLAFLARRGFVTASAEYRTSNIASYPAAVKDIKAAVRYLKAHADRYNIDSGRIGVMGESAGGYLAAMAALARQSEFDEGDFLEYSSEVQAACAWYPPADFSKMAAFSGKNSASFPELLFLGKLAADNFAEAAAASPVSFVSPHAPPFLIIHGNRDAAVPFSCSESLYEKLSAAGCDAQLIEIDGAGHADVRFFQDEIWDEIGNFFLMKLADHSL